MSAPLHRGLPFESWIDEQIRQARERGEFEKLAGTGRPLPGVDGPPEENWWIKEKLRREGFAHLPDSLQVKLDLDRLLARLGSISTEAEVRAELKAMDERIRRINRTVTQGPSTTVAPLELEGLVARWRAARTSKT